MNAYYFNLHILQKTLNVHVDHLWSTYVVGFFLFFNWVGNGGDEAPAPPPFFY